MFFSCLSHIWKIFTENISFSQKIDYLEIKHRITQKNRISQQFLLWANPEEYFYLMETTPFIQTSDIVQILTKMIYLLPKTHIQLNYAFQLFWIISWENLLKTSRFSQKIDYFKIKHRTALKVSISQQFLFLANPKEYFYLMETFLLFKPVE